MTTEEMETRWRDLPERLETFADHVVDGEASILEAASTREPTIPEPRPKMDLVKHNVFTHFPKDPHCEMCRRTKITRAPCGKRSSNYFPRAEKCGDLIAADHKVLKESVSRVTVTGR